MKNHGKIYGGLPAGPVFMAILVCLITGAGFLGVRQIHTHADLLVSRHLPQWALASAIYKQAAEAAHFMTMHGQKGDPAMWEKARTAADLCMQHIRNAQQMARDEAMNTLSDRLGRMETTLGLYLQVMARSRSAAEAIAENHRTVRRSANLFIENIQAYNTLQQQDMQRQIHAAFGGQSMMRFGLDLTSGEELEIRRQRIQAGARILARGSALYAVLWEAEAHRDETSLAALLPEIRSLHTDMSGLLQVTRQPQNLHQLQSGLSALEANVTAVESLVRTRQAAEDAAGTQENVCRELLALASALSAEAHDKAMDGGRKTRSIVEKFAGRPMQAALIATLSLFSLLLCRALLSGPRAS